MVGGGPFQLDMIRTAKRMGLWVAVVDGDRAAPGLALADRAVVNDTSDVAGVVRAADQLGVDGVVTAASDAAVAAVAAVGAARGLLAVSPAAAADCRDKLATYRRLSAAGYWVPPTVEARTPSAEAVAEVGGYPLVVKPRAAAGGRGVSVVRRPTDLGGAFTRALRYAPSALVQRYVGGYPVGAEAFFHRGRLEGLFVMDDQFTPGFVSPVGHSLPSQQSPARIAAVRRAVEGFADALGLRDGPANFDLRYEQGQVVLLEVNARPGGNAIPDLIRAAHGVDLARAAVSACLGHDPLPALAVRKTQPAACRLLVKKGRGRMMHAAELAAHRARPGVVDIEYTADRGRQVATVVDDHAILGRCLVKAATPEAATERAAVLAAELEGGLRLDPDPADAPRPKVSEAR